MRSADAFLPAWLAPPAVYRSAPFWSWNSRLDPDRLCRAIESMHAAGMGGFFMHSRYGLKTPYLSREWFQCVAACIEKARALGMKAYLYDEDRWPSGSGGGLVTRDQAEFRSHALTAAEVPEATDRPERLALFTVELDAGGEMTSYQAAEPGASASPGEGTRLIAFDVRTDPPSPWHNDGTYLDTMNPEAVAEFIHLTHQAYADHCGKDFGDVVPAIFTDEPNYGRLEPAGADRAARLPWTAELPREFIRRRGYDLREHLPELVFRPAGEAFSSVRHDYVQTVGELFVESFSAQIGQWCRRHRLALTGHMLAEETLRSQTRVIGAAMPHYEHMQWPGIDILTDQARELATAKQCSSVADQLGKERVLSELYGCTGWDWPLEGHKFVGDWHLATGVNFRCPHLTHYSLAGGAKRDYPASLFGHSPWWKHYRAVEDYFARLSLMLTQGRPVRDVLVIHPIQSAWGLYGLDDRRLGDLERSLDRTIRALTGGHYDWDFGDESLLAKHATVAGEVVKVGRMSYRLVVVPPCLTLRGTTVSLLEKLLDGGGKVLSVGPPPDRMDARPSRKPADVLARADRCGEADEEFLSAVEGAVPRRVSIAEDGRELRCTWAMLRRVTGGQVLFIQSHDRREAHRARVRVAGRRPVVRWDPLTGGQERIRARAAGDSVEFELPLPPTGSALVTLGLSVRGAAPPPATPAVIESRSIEGPYDVVLTEPNTFPLDYCAYRFPDESPEFSPPMPTLRADTLIRKRFGLGSRFGREHQPWYLYATGAVDTAPRGRCEMRWTFHVSDVPARCAVAMERPEDFEVRVNGRPAGEPGGFWVDEDFRTIDVTDLVRAGDNEVLLRFDYRPDMELEDLYLVGEFGVAGRAGGPPAPGGMTLTAPPMALDVGPWVGQGLDFYGGSVCYRVDVDRPARGRRVRVRLPGVSCTAAAVYVGSLADPRGTFVLPWAPFAADITDALTGGTNEVFVEVIGGRKNILGPLHTPWGGWTGPGQFDPSNAEWTDAYQLTDHGLTAPIVVETLG